MRSTNLALLVATVAVISISGCGGEEVHSDFQGVTLVSFFADW